ncbi:hypothetical protein AncyloWKF20_05365 [Ancylobacter sp. WKF20]|uniref:hypothetical protein n=1 Tax=Ancylobacter sp. WKF20 TaxID=3039801 RepID=UPI00243412CE|nr:hypothetical protein [Ancylobacter sp. WKF20]WGD31254.1 hypothetical protein AncyloWKF20_05365 [Ancylobacter sp. WKF20]
MVEGLLAKLPALAASITGGARFEALDAGDEADHRGIYVHALLAQKPWSIPCSGTAARPIPRPFGPAKPGAAQ